MLYTGDILYMPRGTIHEAITQDLFSTHITISLYQKYHYKLLLQNLLPNLLERAFNDSGTGTENSAKTRNFLSFRSGLPINLSNIYGSYVSKCILPYIEKVRTLVTSADESYQFTNGSSSSIKKRVYTPTIEVGIYECMHVQITTSTICYIPLLFNIILPYAV